MTRRILRSDRERERIFFRDDSCEFSIVSVLFAENLIGDYDKRSFDCAARAATISSCFAALLPLVVVVVVVVGGGGRFSESARIVSLFSG